MLTRKGKLAVTIVRNMHVFAGRILDTADFIESRIKTEE